MHKFTIGIVFLLVFITSNDNGIKYNRKIIDNTGKVINIGPGERLVYHYYPNEWFKLSLEYKIELLRMDSIAYSYKGTYKKLMDDKYRELRRHGTPQSRAWGIHRKFK